MDRNEAVRRRRRGSSLDAAILDAAWEILVEFGHRGLTFEAVAARAATSRPVLARRWATRDELTLAAIERQWSAHPIEMPDTGSLREDAIEVLRRASSARAPLMRVLNAQLAAYFAESGNSLNTVRTLLDRPGSPNGCAQIVARAVERGEIPNVARTTRLIDLPFDLLRHDILVTRDAVPDAALVEIIDDVWLPLLNRPAQ